MSIMIGVNKNMKEMNIMKDKKEKPTSKRIQCEKPININIHSNSWKFWIFDVVIFTFFISRIINKVDR